MGVSNSLRDWLDKGVIRPLDWALAQGVAEQAQQGAELIARVVAQVSYKTAQQHSCVSVVELASLLKVDDLHSRLQGSDVVMQVDNPLMDKSQAKPLVLDAGYLYLHKYWYYEQQLAEFLQTASAVQYLLDNAQVAELLSVLFEGGSDATQPDWQKVAVAVAARQKFCVITGGPGTGKTTTVTRLMALLQNLAREQGSKLTIKLAAPTGKAAARLNESIAQALAHLPQSLNQGLQVEACTLHRLLGAKANSPHFYANRHHPLHLDLLIVDEASMVDLPLMAKTLDALPAHARLILLGDQQQLASVEVGSVLADICAAAGASFSPAQQAYLTQVGALAGDYSGQAEGGILSDNLVTLQKSYRFDQHSGIGQLASAVIQGQTQRALAILQDPGFSDLQWQQHASHNNLLHSVLPHYQAYFDCVEQGDLAGAFSLLGKMQILCAYRQGEWGIETINQQIEAALLVNLSDGDFYAGRPLMLTQNLPSLGLYNGDVGICHTDDAGVNKVWFQLNSELVGFLPSALAGLETHYAMSIHKSQGSEYQQVYLCLPPLEQITHKQSLNRELLYTGLTRAKKQCVILAQQPVLALALSQGCTRSTGLAAKLKAREKCYKK